MKKRKKKKIKVKKLMIKFFFFFFFFFFKIIKKEKKVTLEYVGEPYEILVQLIEILNENFISIIVKKEVKTIDYIYDFRKKYDDFKHLGSKLLRLYENVQEIYNFISDSLDKNRLTISEMTYHTLTLIISIPETFGFNENLSFPLKLKRKNFEMEDTIRDLYERINTLENKNKRIVELENENKELVKRIMEIEKYASKLNVVPEFSLHKFSLIVYSRHNTNNGQCMVHRFRTPVINNWTYTPIQKCLPNSQNNNKIFPPLFAIISECMDNNIIIFCGNVAPSKSYYVQLVNDTTKNNNFIEGLFYDDNYICPTI